MASFNGKQIHMVGIKGVGMTALAELLVSLGAHVSGSDIDEEFHTDRVLKRLNIKPFNFNVGNITSGVNLLIYSSAYGSDHPERKMAEKLHIPQMSYAEALADIFNQKMGIMVAGSHGKTTTTALLGHIMTAAGLDPTVVVGGTVIAWDSNVRIGKSEWMIAEGDEYQEKFLNFKPSHLLITNVDYDHPDTYPDKKSYRKAFEKLKSQTKEKIFSHETVKPLNPEAVKPFASDYLLGEHNLRNLNLVLALVRELGIGDETIKKGLGDFRGVRRRAEIYFNKNGLIIMDDYAHHPAEISATLKAVKEHWPDYQITVIFQPHTFSRTKALLSEFARAFAYADKIYLAPTYSSAREPKEENAGIDKILYDKLSKCSKYCRSGVPREKELILNRAEKQIFITMGAGDLWQTAKKLANLADSKYK